MDHESEINIYTITSTRSTIMSSICVTVPTEHQTVSTNNLFSLLSARSDPQCAQRWKNLKWTISYFSTFGGFIW